MLCAFYHKAKPSKARVKRKAHAARAVMTGYGQWGWSDMDRLRIYFEGRTLGTWVKGKEWRKGVMEKAVCVVSLSHQKGGVAVGGEGDAYVGNTFRTR